MLQMGFCACVTVVYVCYAYDWMVLCMLRVALRWPFRALGALLPHDS